MTESVKVAEAEALQHPGYVVDVPVTLSVAVRGPGITENQAAAAARRWAEGIQPTGDVMVGYAIGTDGALLVVTEATLESPSDEMCETLDELDPE